MMPPMSSDPMAPPAQGMEPVAEPMPGDAQVPPGVLPLSKEDLTFWRTEIERADKLRSDTIQAWDATGNLERYTPKSVLTSDGGSVAADVNVAKDFSDVERKNAALFHSTPQIALVPDPGTDPGPLLLHQELLNTILGEDYMDVLETVSPTIQDCLVAIQPCPTEIGYDSVIEHVEQQVPVLDPVTQQPQLDSMTGQPVMQTQQVPVVVWEEIFWRRISPKAQLMPVTLRDTKYDRAPWIGYRWRRPISQVKRKYQLPDNWSAADSSTNTPYFEPLTNQGQSSEPMCSGVKLWYRAYLRDQKVTHPEVVRELELLDSYDVPLVHRNTPYQDISPKDGRLTPDSIIGYPDHPLALRDLTDSAYVAADCTITAPLTRELNKFRKTVVQRRDGSKLRFVYDAAKLNPEVRQKIEQGDDPMMIPVEPGALDAGANAIMQQVPSLELGRESYLGQDIIERDRAQILGINANQVGAVAGSGKTATEVSDVQRNADARFDREMRRAVRWYLKGVQKVSALVLRYGDRLAVDILGPERATLWAQAKQAGAISKFKFKTVADSGGYIDIEARKRSDLQLYNMTAKDPSLNRQVVQARLATDFGLAPSEWIVTQPPEQKPEAPTLSIAVKPEDLDPALPSYVGTYAILTAGGVKNLPPPTYVAAPPPQPNAPEHGGMAELQPRLNQHQLDQTGERSGPKVM